MRLLIQTTINENILKETTNINMVNGLNPGVSVFLFSISILSSAIVRVSVVLRRTFGDSD